MKLCKFHNLLIGIIDELINFMVHEHMESLSTVQANLYRDNLPRYNNKHKDCVIATVCSRMYDRYTNV